jgi:hypothetical protein
LLLDRTVTECVEKAIKPAGDTVVAFVFVCSSRLSHADSYFYHFQNTAPLLQENSSCGLWEEQSNKRPSRCPICYFLMTSWAIVNSDICRILCRIFVQYRRLETTLFATPDQTGPGGSCLDLGPWILDPGSWAFADS